MVKKYNNDRLTESALSNSARYKSDQRSIGIVLSGGGVRAAYQIGALKALAPYLKTQEDQIKVIIGSSIGAINGLLIGACLKEGIEHTVEVVENMWLERNYKNTFSGSVSLSFVKAMKVAMMQYIYPGPNPDTDSIFNPTPLMDTVNRVLEEHGGLKPENRRSTLESIGVMTTVEGEERRPLLFVSSHREMSEEVMRGATFDTCYVPELKAKHGFASAALPAVLPPIELDTKRGTVRLVDGGISQNVPVDPAARLGADRTIVIDISGRDWWHEQYNEAPDARPTWEVPAEADTFCLRPPDTFVVRCRKPLGGLLKDVIGGSTSKSIKTFGPTWPVFSAMKKIKGEAFAYESLSYVALDPDYIRALIERGYNETVHILRNRVTPKFEHPKTYKEMFEQVVGDEAVEERKTVEKKKIKEKK